LFSDGDSLGLIAHGELIQLDWIGLDWIGLDSGHLDHIVRRIFR